MKVTLVLSLFGQVIFADFADDLNMRITSSVMKVSNANVKTGNVVFSPDSLMTGINNIIIP